MLRPQQAKRANPAGFQASLSKILADQRQRRSVKKKKDALQSRANRARRGGSLSPWSPSHASTEDALADGAAEAHSAGLTADGLTSDGNRVNERASIKDILLKTELDRKDASVAMVRNRMKESLLTIQKSRNAMYSSLTSESQHGRAGNDKNPLFGGTYTASEARARAAQSGGEGAAQASISHGTIKMSVLQEAMQLLSRGEIDDIREIFGLLCQQSYNLSAQEVSQLRIKGHLRISRTVFADAVKLAGFEKLTEHELLIERIFFVLAHFHRGNEHKPIDRDINSILKSMQQEAHAFQQGRYGAPLPNAQEHEEKASAEETRKNKPSGNAQKLYGKKQKQKTKKEDEEDNSRPQMLHGKPRALDSDLCISEVAFTRTVALLLHGSLRQKLRLFYLFMDVDDDGVLSAQDVFTCLEFLGFAPFREDTTRVYNALRRKCTKLRSAKRQGFLGPEYNPFVGILLESMQIESAKAEQRKIVQNAYYHQGVNSEPEGVIPDVQQVLHGYAQLPDKLNLSVITRDVSHLNFHEFLDSFKRTAAGFPGTRGTDESDINSGKAPPDLGVVSSQGFIAPRKPKLPRASRLVGGNKNDSFFPQTSSASSSSSSSSAGARPVDSALADQPPLPAHGGHALPTPLTAFVHHNSVEGRASSMAPNQPHEHKPRMSHQRRKRAERARRDLLALFSAVRSNSERIMRLLLDNRDLIISGVLDLSLPAPASEVHSSTMLHAAVHGCVFPVVKRLLECNADPNIRDSRLNTPLHIASMVSFKDGVLDIIEYLLEVGADPHLRNATDHTAMQTCNNSYVRDFVQRWRAGLNDEMKFNMTHVEPMMLRVLTTVLFGQFHKKLAELREAEKQRKLDKMTAAKKKKETEKEKIEEGLDVGSSGLLPKVRGSKGSASARGAAKNPRGGSGKQPSAPNTARNSSTSSQKGPAPPGNAPAFSRRHTFSPFLQNNTPKPRQTRIETRGHTKAQPDPTIRNVRLDSISAPVGFRKWHRQREVVKEKQANNRALKDPPKKKSVRLLGQSAKTHTHTPSSMQSNMQLLRVAGPLGGNSPSPRPSPRLSPRPSPSPSPRHDAVQFGELPIRSPTVSSRRNSGRRQGSVLTFQTRNGLGGARPKPVEKGPDRTYVNQPTSKSKGPTRGDPSQALRHNAFPIYQPSLRSHGEMAAERVALEDHEDITALKLKLIRAEGTSSYFNDGQGRSIPPPSKYARRTKYTREVAVDSISQSETDSPSHPESAPEKGLLSVGEYQQMKYTPEQSARTLHLLRRRKNKIF
jgi:hypothetical protein